jgi:glucose-1-phosphate thymidylyltransferase
MRPLTADQPKGLVDIGGKPLLSHVFETLIEAGVTELIVVVGYRGEQIREYYGESFDGLPVRYVEQDSRDGLADALLRAEPHLDGDFLLLNGDNVLRANASAVVERHFDSDADATTLVEEVSDRRARKGAVFETEGERITGLVEKPDDPPSNLVPRGFYAFSPKILPACELVTPNATGEYELTDAVDLLLSAGRAVETVPLEGWCTNVNTPEDRRHVEKRL